ncbi:hypothetical protein Tco_1132200 [Tanacetum coccineum]|uniref:Uncharacterized protein n=1 Tax=Tanacetum coccineum TaxID=301880 RepID=A0ABQ5JB95_9ASTR
MAYTANSSGSDTEFGLESVEAQLVVHQKNEAVYEEKIAVLEFEVKDKILTRFGSSVQLALPKQSSFKAAASTVDVPGIKQIHAIVDGKAVVISKSSVRNDLLFDDEDGITCLTNDEIFENLALMGYEQLSTKLTFQKGDGYRWQSQVSRNYGGAPAQTRSERVLKQPNEPPLSEGHTSRSEEGGMEHTFKLMDIVLDLEKEKDAQAVEILKLNKRVKKLERQRKSSISHSRRRIYRQVESSNDDLDKEDASKQGRTSDKTKPMFKDSDFDYLDDLVDEGMDFVQEKDAENQGKIGADDTEAVNTAGEGVITAAPRTPPTTTTVFDDEDVTMVCATQI